MNIPTATIPKPKKNGNPPPQQADTDESYRHHVEQTFAKYDAVVRECELLRAKMGDAIAGLKSAAAESDALRTQINSLESRIISYQLERDQAVAQRAAYETLFASFQAMMREFNVPAVPLIRTKQSEGDEAVLVGGPAAWSGHAE